MNTLSKEWSGLTFIIIVISDAYWKFTVTIQLNSQTTKVHSMKSVANAMAYNNSTRTPLHAMATICTTATYIRIVL